MKNSQNLQKKGGREKHFFTVKISRKSNTWKKKIVPVKVNRKSHPGKEKSARERSGGKTSNYTHNILFSIFLLTSTVLVIQNWGFKCFEFFLP